MPTATQLPPGAPGAKLRQARETAGLSQDDLADRSGVPQYAISRIERGREPTATELARLIRALRVKSSVALDWYGASGNPGYLSRVIIALSPPVPAVA